MLLLGLTGSIGMGKSETAKMFQREGVPLHDADAEVHKLQAPGGPALPPIEAAFPGVVVDGVLDRQELGKRVFGKPDELRKLERIIHPMVGKVQRQFLMQASARRLPMVVLDIPLLFETGGDADVDMTIVVTAPEETQRARVMERPGMTAEKFEHLKSQQMPDAEKRAKADVVIKTTSLEAARASVHDVLGTIRGRLADAGNRSRH